MAQLPGDARVNQYTATAGQTTFIYDFKIYDDDEIIVQQGSTTLTLTTHYTVTDAGEEAGGTIVLVTGATVDDKITLTGNTMVERDTTFSNGGDFAASAINGEYNKILSQLSENVTDLGKAVRLEVYDASFDTTIPTPVARKALMINTAGTGFEMSTNDPDTVVTTSAANLAACLVAETAAELAETNAELAETNAEAAQVAAEAAQTAAEAAAASISFSAIAEDMLPATDATYDLGSTTKSWAEVHCEDLAVQDDATVAGDLAVTGALSVNTNKFAVVAASGNTTVAGTLGVTGAITATAGIVGGAESDITLNTDKFTVDATNGNTVIAGTLSVGGSAVGGAAKAALYSYEVAFNVNGGNYDTANTWQTRPLNAENFDTINATLTANRVTLPAGTYTAYTTCDAYDTGYSLLRILDYTNTAVLGLGTEFYNTGNFKGGTCYAAFTLAASAEIEVQMIGTLSQAGTGMGYGHATAGMGNNVYAQLLITQLA